MEKSIKSFYSGHSDFTPACNNIIWIENKKLMIDRKEPLVIMNVLRTRIPTGFDIKLVSILLS